MGWEQRNGKRYYYRKRREGGRVVSKYVGTGEIAGLLFAIDQSEREERQQNRAEWKRQKDDIEKFDKDKKTLALLTRHILQACLLAKGYHPHKGQWRKNRMADKREMILEINTSVFPVEFAELVKRAYKKNPDPKDIKELRKWLEGTPGLWRAVFDLADMIQKHFIDRLLTEEAAQIAIQRNVFDLKQELGYANSSALEKLLIENIISAWLRNQWTDYQLAAFMGKDNVSVPQREFWERRLSMCQHRFLRACEMLARVRRLLAPRPAVQVNIAAENGQQVNIAGDLHTAKK